MSIDHGLPYLDMYYNCTYLWPVNDTRVNWRPNSCIEFNENLNAEKQSSRASLTSLEALKRTPDGRLPTSAQWPTELPITSVLPGKIQQWQWRILQHWFPSAFRNFPLCPARFPTVQCANVQWIRSKSRTAGYRVHCCVLNGGFLWAIFSNVEAKSLDDFITYNHTTSR